MCPIPDYSPAILISVEVDDSTLTSVGVHICLRLHDHRHLWMYNSLHENSVHFKVHVKFSVSADPALRIFSPRDVPLFFTNLIHGHFIALHSSAQSRILSDTSNMNRYRAYLSRYSRDAMCRSP